MGTINFTGTGGIWEGSVGSNTVVINQDRVNAFDGTGYKMDSTAYFASTFDDITIMFWATKDDLTDTSSDRLFTANGGNDLRVYLQSDLLRFRHTFADADGGGVSEDTNFNLTNEIANDTWFHVACTYSKSGGYSRIYLNGVRKNSIAASKSLKALDSATDAWSIARGVSGSEPYPGKIIDVKVYEAALGDTQMQIAAAKINQDPLLISSTQPVGWWKIAGPTISITDDIGSLDMVALGTPTVVYDEFSVNVHDATTTTNGILTITQGKLECKSMSSVLFDGSSFGDFIDIGTAWQPGTSAITLSCWAYNIVTPVGHDVLIVNRDPSLDLAKIEANGNLWRFEWDNANAVDAPAASVINNQWQHIVGVYDGSTNIHIYVDGVLEGTTAVSGTPDVQANDWRIASYPPGSGGETFGGRIRDARIYDYGLSTEQVASLYSGSYNVTPRHWWKLDEGRPDEDGSEELNNAADAFSDSGTGTAAHGQGDSLVDASCVNGTLDLDSTLTIAANGTLSAPRGDLDCAGVLSRSGTFTHNNGTFNFTGGSTTYIHATTMTGSNAFYNLKGTTTGTLWLRIDADIDVEHDLPAGTDCVLWIYSATVTLGTDTYASGTDAAFNWDYLYGEDGQTGKLYGASPLYPFQLDLSNTVEHFLTGASDGKMGASFIKNGNIIGTLTTGGNTNTLTLDGDMEFDAVTVSSGDTLDLNGQRVVFSGTLNNLSNLKTTNSLVFINKLTTSSVTSGNAWSGSTAVITGATSNNDWSAGTSPNQDLMFERIVLNSGGATEIRTSNPQGGDGTGNKLIVASGTLTTNNNDMILSEATIPTGGTLVAGSSTLTDSGDFTTSGGLLGASCFEPVRTDKQYALVVDHADLDLVATRDQLTVEGWFKTSNTTNDQYIVDRRGSINSYVISIDGGANKLKVRNYTGGTTTEMISNATVNDGKWHHFALTWDGDIAGNADSSKLYIDGKLDSQTANSGSMSTSASNIYIGCKFDIGDTTFFDGAIDEIRVFAHPKTEAEIRADMFQGGTLATTTDLVGRWQFNEGTDSDVEGGTNVDAIIYSQATGSAVANTAAWAGAGNFNTSGDFTSTIIMNKDFDADGKQTIYYKNSEEIYSLTIHADSVTELHCTDNSGGRLDINGNLIVNGIIKPTTTGTSTNASLAMWAGDKTLTIANATTGMASLYRFTLNHPTGTITIPYSYHKRLVCGYWGGTTVQGSTLRVTEEFEVQDDHTYNASAETLEFKVIDIHNGSTVDFSGCLIEQKPAHEDGAIGFGPTASITMGNAQGRGVAILGKEVAGQKTSFNCPAAGDWTVIGGGQGGAHAIQDCHILADGDITVIGTTFGNTFADSTANIHQHVQNIDTNLMLDMDSTDDDDVKLNRPALDNSLSITTGD